MSQTVSHRLSQRVSQRVSRRVNQRVSQRVNQRLSQTVSQRVNQRVSQRVSQSLSQNVSQRKPESEPESEPESARERVCEPDWARESQKVRQRGPESELQGLKMSLRVTLGPNLGCQSQPSSLSLKTLIFLRFFYDSCQKQQFYDVFLRVRVTKYYKLHAYMRGRGANTGAAPFDNALQILSVRTPSV